MSRMCTGFQLSSWIFLIACAACLGVVAEKNRSAPATTPKQAAQAIRKIYELGWKPVHIVDINASPVSATLQPAGLEASKGVISVQYGKDPADPTWKDDAGLKKYLDFMTKYFPEGDKMNTVNSYGYSTAQLLVQVLKQCGDDLTRENVMRQAASLKNVARSGPAGHRRQHQRRTTTASTSSCR